MIEHIPLRHIVWRAVEAAFGGNLEKLQVLLPEHAFCIADQGVMEEAAKHDCVGVLKLLIDAGVSPDYRPRYKQAITSFKPLYVALWKHKHRAAEFLLDSGADIHDLSILNCAVIHNNFKMIKMILERGADVNATYLRYGEPFNALKWAVVKGHNEIVDYLRAHGAVWPEELNVEDATPTELKLKHLSEYFRGKPLPLGIGEIVPASVPMMVHIFPANQKRNTTVFVTSGLMEYALVVPEGLEEYMFAEYFLEMPGDWPVTDEALAQEKYFWPIAWLKAIGRYPHENTTYYEEEQIVTPAMIPSLTSPDGKYCSARVERVLDLCMIMSKNQTFMNYYRITLCDSKGNPVPVQ